MGLGCNRARVGPARASCMCAHMDEGMCAACTQAIIEACRQGQACLYAGPLCLRPGSDLQANTRTVASPDSCANIDGRAAGAGQCVRACVRAWSAQMSAHTSAHMSAPMSMHETIPSPHTPNAHVHVHIHLHVFARVCTYVHAHVYAHFYIHVPAHVYRYGAADCGGHTAANIGAYAKPDTGTCA